MNSSKFGSIILVLICSLIFSQCNSYESNDRQDVDLLVKNGRILTMNTDREILDRGMVAVKGNEIIAVEADSNASNYSAKTIVDADGDIVMPGLINTHTHVSMSVFRSLADDVPDRLHRYIFPLEDKLVSRNMVRIGAQLGNIEMIKGGVTTYADMYYFEDEVAKTVDEIGMRGVLGETVIQFSVADAENAQEGIEYALNFIEEYKDHPRITPAFAPHAPYTNTTEVLQQVTNLSQKHDVPVMIHLAESDQESQEIADRSDGLSPVSYMAKIGALTDNLVAAHVINADEKDLNLLKEHDVGVAHNMSANIKSAKGVAPVLKMLEKNIRVGLGTDGPMSGNTLSTLDEFSQVAKVHKLVNDDRSVMPPINVIEMATIGAARALHMEDEIGSLEEGKLADIIVVDTKAPNMIPIYNLYSALVYSAYPTNVKHMIVDGKLLMKDRNMLTIDEDSVRKKALRFADTVRETIIRMDEVVQ